MHTSTFAVFEYQVRPGVFRTRPKAMEFTVHHNGDWSGDVLISTTTEEGRNPTFEDGKVQVTLPADLLKQIVAAYIVGQRISELEQMSAEEVLGL
jgi:hypothetical protein